MNKKITSSKFKDLKLFAKKNKNKYLKSKPFPHIIVKNFFDKKFL